MSGIINEVKALIARGVDVDRGGQSKCQEWKKLDTTPLLAASYMENAKIVRTLLAAGAKANLPVPSRKVDAI